MIEIVKEDVCIGCGKCVLVCPVDVLRMVRNGNGKKVAQIVYRNECQSCFLCEEYCPVDAIYVAPDRSPLHALVPAVGKNGGEA